MSGELDAPRHCAHPGCAASFDIGKVMGGEARADGWTLYKPHSDYYCPDHQDSLVPAAHRRLVALYGADWLSTLLRRPGPWDVEDLHDALVCCPTPSLAWRRMCAEALASLGSGATESADALLTTIREGVS